MKIELLSPAGDFETLIGCVNAGANAIYIGGSLYSARASATNFNLEEIKQAVIFCHLYNVKLFVAINTLIYNEEIDDVIKYADILAGYGVDAFIVQDYGLISVFTKRYNNVEIHASTQTNALNINDCIFLKKLGVKRIILGREASIEDVISIKKEVDIDIEVFTHGALCFSYSGNCYFSRYKIKGRSGNRGSCAQLCRKEFSLLEEDNVIDKGFLISMKELNTSSKVDELIKAGVSCIKIEGRLRRKEYALITTLLYRSIIDGKTKDSIKYSKYLELIFNRKYTEGYLFNETDIINKERPNHMGIPIGIVVSSTANQMKIKLEGKLSVRDGYRVLQKIDFGDNISRILKDNKPVEYAGAGEIVAIDIKKKADVGSKVLLTRDYALDVKLGEYFNKDYNKINVSGYVKAYLSSGIQFFLEYKGKTFTKEIQCEKAVKAGLSEDDLLTQFSKSGDYPFVLKLTVYTDSLCFSQKSALNNLRNAVLDELYLDCTKEPLNPINYDYKLDIPSNVVLENNVSAKISTKAQLKEVMDCNIKNIYYEEGLDIYKAPTFNYYCYLSRTTSNIKTINNVVSSVGQIRSNDDITSEFLPVTNAYSALLLLNFCKRITLSKELDEEHVKSFSTEFYRLFHFYPNIEYVIYAKSELMISKTNLISEKSTNKNYYLNSEMDKTLLHSDINDNMIIFDNKPTLTELNSFKKYHINNIRVNFINETKDEVNNIINNIKKFL
jgi:putative protease